MPGFGELDTLGAAAVNFGQYFVGLHGENPERSTTTGDYEVDYKKTTWTGAEPLSDSLQDAAKTLVEASQRVSEGSMEPAAAKAKQVKDLADKILAMVVAVGQQVGTLAGSEGPLQPGGDTSMQIDFVLTCAAKLPEFLTKSSSTFKDTGQTQDLTFAASEAFASLSVGIAAGDPRLAALLGDEGAKQFNALLGSKTTKTTEGKTDDETLWRVALRDVLGTKYPAADAWFNKLVNSIPVADIRVQSPRFREALDLRTAGDNKAASEHVSVYLLDFWNEATEEQPRGAKGEETGEETGEKAGEQTGEETGKETGEEPGGRTGEEPGGLTGEETGEETGEVSGEETGERSLGQSLNLFRERGEQFLERTGRDIRRSMNLARQRSEQFLESTGRDIRRGVQSVLEGEFFLEGGGKTSEETIEATKLGQLKLFALHGIEMCDEADQRFFELQAKAASKKAEAQAGQASDLERQERIAETKKAATAKLNQSPPEKLSEDESEALAMEDDEAEDKKESEGMEQAMTP